jgi:hypothetical protein
MQGAGTGRGRKREPSKKNAGQVAAAAASTAVQATAAAVKGAIVTATIRLSGGRGEQSSWARVQTLSAASLQMLRNDSIGALPNCSLMRCPPDCLGTLQRDLHQGTAGQTMTGSSVVQGQTPCQIKGLLLPHMSHQIL